MSKERGFILLSVIFLTLITSFMAMMVLNANLKVQQRNSNLRLTAIYLAEEQFAELENLASTGDLSEGDHKFLGDEEDLISRNFLNDEDAPPIKFDVATTISDNGDLKNVSVKVSWIVNGEEFYIKSEKIIFAK